MKAVMCTSPKGGTGKTFTAVNIALRLARVGKKVALLDADIDSPNVPDLLRFEGEIEISGVNVKRFEPVTVQGVQVFSMGWLSKDKPVSMRGEWYTEVLSNAVNKCNWNPANEFMIIDLPAGISDEVKFVISTFKDDLVGSIIVVQPSNTEDAIRAMKYHILEEIPVLGIIENMAYYTCGKCKEVHKIFGEGITEQLCEEYGLPYLGKIPLSDKLAEQLKVGNAFVEGEEYTPLDKAVQRAISAKTVRPGFIQRQLHKGKELVRDLFEEALAGILININQAGDLAKEVGNKGYTRGAIVRLKLCNERMDKIIWSGGFQQVEGNLMALARSDIADFDIYAWDQSVIWGMLGEAKVLNPESQKERWIPYTFKDAFWQNKIIYKNVSGRVDRGMADVVDLINVFDGVGKRFGGNIEAILRRLA